MAAIIICDDQEAILRGMETKIKNTDVQNVHRIFLYEDGRRMLEDLEEGFITGEIFIMDIELGSCNGISLAERILDLAPEAQIIFMSGYDDYYEAVYDVNHIYFLQKPVREDALKKALDIAGKRLHETKQSCFYVENKSGRFVVPYSKIFAFEKQSRKIILRGADRLEICSFYGKLEELIPTLPETFCRCHNSIIVNMEKVKSLSKDSFIMNDGNYVSISRSHRNAVLLEFAKYTNRMMP